MAHSEHANFLMVILYYAYDLWVKILYIHDEYIHVCVYIVTKTSGGEW